MEKTDLDHTEAPPIFIKQLMRAKGLKNKDVAEIIGTTEANVSRKLTGARKLDVIWLQAFAKALKVHISELFLDPDKPAVKITRPEDIHAFLERVQGLKPHNIESFVTMIENTMTANAASRAENANGDQSELDTRRREGQPSR